MQRDKAAMEKQVVLDNIHLLRLQEMFPEARIRSSEQISKVLENY